MKLTDMISRLLCLAAMAGALLLNGACSKEPPPQPPVVINLNSPATVTPEESPDDKQVNKKQTAGAGASNSLSSPAPAARQEVPAYQAPSFDIENMDEASFFNLQIHEMAVQLMKNFHIDPGPEGPIAVATFVDLNNLYRTSPFGRYVAEQLMGELQRAGFNVVEIRKTETIMIKEKFGEYGLSRDVQEIAQESSASYVLAGTYVTRGRYIMLNARLISNQNNMVASSGLKILRRDPFLDKMLRPTASPEDGKAVRIPIKELGQISDIKILSES
ncbi:MAG: hypothetical protein DSZ23_03250 [Thermodesulfatator sp.]|nr:MAG: hypothetical protein DSZ23_03250 [Thermodesulfatator sp.]